MLWRKSFDIEGIVLNSSWYFKLVFGEISVREEKKKKSSCQSLSCLIVCVYFSVNKIIAPCHSCVSDRRIPKRPAWARDLKHRNRKSFVYQGEQSWALSKDQRLGNLIVQCAVCDKNLNSWLGRQNAAWALMGEILFLINPQGIAQFQIINLFLWSLCSNRVYFNSTVNVPNFIVWQID